MFCVFYLQRQCHIIFLCLLCWPLEWLILLRKFGCFAFSSKLDERLDTLLSLILFACTVIISILNFAIHFFAEASSKFLHEMDCMALHYPDNYSAHIIFRRD